MEDFLLDEAEYVYCAHLFLNVLCNHPDSWYEEMTEYDILTFNFGIMCLCTDLGAGNAAIFVVDEKEKVVFSDDALVYGMGLSTTAYIDCIEHEICDINSYRENFESLDIWTQLEIDEKLRKNKELLEVFNNEG